MPRVMIQYADKTNTYCWFEDGDEPKVIIGRENYTLKEIADTGAVMVVNNSALLKRFNELGIKARPTPKQHVISVSVSENTKERMMAASKKVGKNTSRIFEELAVNWLDENGF